ncbi:MAG: 16S rRNA (uracil(1498)-N(3))-methyltransferase [Ramlibacter sp.]|nr:16S rRNA (uracil(1498)-N(3))-methyltransferase [Ramlibacter sp.]
MPRFHCPLPLATGAELELPAGAARHVQVLRLQPGGVITLFNGEGGEFEATIEQMGRASVRVRIGGHSAVEREALRPVHLVVGLMASERMDWLVEKATELGAASLQPLLAERSVLRLSGERAEKKRAHWQAVAVAACEQCGRNRVPDVHPVLGLGDWLAAAASAGANGACVLSLSPDAQPLAPTGMDARHTITLLSGPEGGLSPGEETRARQAGFVPMTLGPRVLRAETAPLAALSRLA